MTEADYIETLYEEAEQGICSNVNTHIKLKMNNWISVKDRLPEDNCKCLIYTDIYFIPDHIDEPNYYKGMEISKYSKEFGFLSINGLYATHWIPLPEPPKED